VIKDVKIKLIVLSGRLSDSNTTMLDVGTFLLDIYMARCVAYTTGKLGIHNCKIKLTVSLLDTSMTFCYTPLITLRKFLRSSGIYIRHDSSPLSSQCPIGLDEDRIVQDYLLTVADTIKGTYFPVIKLSIYALIVLLESLLRYFGDLRPLFRYLDKALNMHK
jgi:hypothetical protein